MLLKKCKTHIKGGVTETAVEVTACNECITLISKAHAIERKLTVD